MVHSLLEYDEDGEIVKTSVRPIVDGGTEGFKGNARVITPGETACIECTLDLYPPQDVLSAEYVYSAWRPDIIRRVLKGFDPNC